MSPRVHNCPACGAANPDDVEKCLSCGEPLPPPAGLPGDDVEIEVYDLRPATRAPSPQFERTLEAARDAVKRDGDLLPPARGDALIQEEIADGYNIRRRRRGYRIYRPRNLIIFGAALGAVAIGVYFVVRGALAQLPQYDYASPAVAAETERALKFAAGEEGRLVPAPAAATAAAAGVLSVTGVDGKVFVDGGYVGDAPLAETPISLGERHVLVKHGGDVLLDIIVEVKAGERYRLEPAVATALYGALGGTATAGRRR